MALLQVFPRLDAIPRELGVHLQRMVDWFLEATKVGLVRYNEDIPHVFQICDQDGKLRCLFKESSEVAGKTEAAVYLLDHPTPTVRRSESPEIDGFTRVPPAVFVRSTHGDIEFKGVLVHFVENVGTTKSYLGDFELETIPLEELQRIALLDLRIGNMDRNPGNILVRSGENGTTVVPIDHEMSFYKYNISEPAWLDWLDGAYGSSLTPECLDYVEGLDPDADIELLKRCGWELEAEGMKCFKVFTTFLKKAVSKGCRARGMGLIASYQCADPKFNLLEMVKSVEERGGDFYDSLNTCLEELLTEYVKEQQKVEERATGDTFV